MQIRRVPPLSRPVSRIGLSVGALLRAGAPHGADPTLIGLLRRARRLGVTYFDAAGGADPAIAERAIATAFPAPDPELVLGTALGPPGASTDPPEVDGRIDEARRRLGDRTPDLVWLAAVDDQGPSDAPEPARAELPQTEGAGPTGTRGRWIVPPAFAGGEELRGATVLRIRYSLLEPEPGASWMARAEAAGVAVVVEDPHADGRLDGSYLQPGAVDGPRPPLGVRELEARYAPMLRLAPLTAGGVRTLPQAAIQFALLPPAVATVLIAPPGPEALDRMVEALDRPPLGPALRPVAPRGGAPVSRPDRPAHGPGNPGTTAAADEDPVPGRALGR